MEYAHIEGVSVPVSRVVMGTDWIGARRFYYVGSRRIPSPFIDRKRNRDNFELLDGVVDAGCTAFDTARSYEDSERTLGAWLRARRLRERVVLISKGAHPGPGWTSRLRGSEISRDLGRSLKALQTDYIDLYLLHYDDDTAPVEPLVDVLNQHVAAGRIRAIGVSNWATRRIAIASGYARTTGQKPFVVSSVQFSLASWQEAPWKNALSISGDESEADRQWYKANDMRVLAYSSLAMGFFSRSRPYADGKSGAPQRDRLSDRVFFAPSNLERLTRANELAVRRGVSPGQIALAWVLRYDPRVLAIVGPRTVAGYVDAARACNVDLSESERIWLTHGT
jgi:aryl-alcohol dehydrogenase-like predicted oxidoreductase